LGEGVELLMDFFPRWRSIERPVDLPMFF